MNSVQDEITKVVLETLSKANDILVKNGCRKIERPVIAFTSRVSRSAGKAGLKRDRLYLQFNLRIAEANFEMFINDTPFHEVAHLMDYIYYGKLGHGSTWEHCCRLLGYNPSRFHRMVVPGMRRYTCPCGDHFNISNLIHRRIQSGQKRTCRRCGGVIFPVTEVTA